MRIAFDFDGVLMLTPFGRLAVHAPSPVAALPDDYQRFYGAPVPSNLPRLALEYARFAWRRTAPAGPATIRRLAASHEIYVVTGRSAVGAPLVRQWLRRHQIEDRVAGIRMAPGGLRPAQHKLAAARMLGIDAHIDDDPRTAYHLARNGIRVYLLDHAGAHGDIPFPENLTLVRSLAEFADALSAAD